MGGCSYPELLCYLVALQANLLLGQEQTPAQLAKELLDGSCNGDNFTDFYLRVRERQNVNRRYPPWPNNGKLFFHSDIEEPIVDPMLSGVYDSLCSRL